MLGRNYFLQQQQQQLLNSLNNNTSPSSAATSNASLASASSISAISTSSSSSPMSQQAANISATVYDLVKWALPSDQDAIQRVFQYALRILGSRMTPTICSDEQQIADMIKKRLLRLHKSSPDKAIQFSNLFNKLGNKKTLKNRWAILYLLLSVSEQASSNVTDTGAAAADAVMSAIEHSFSSLGLPSLDTHSTTFTPTPQPHQQSLRPPSSIRPGSMMSQYTTYTNAADSAIGNSTMTMNTDGKFMKVPLPREVPAKQSTPIEQVLLRDLLYVFQGIDGKYIMFSDAADAYLLTTESTDITSTVTPPMREMVNKLAEMGWLYRRVKGFVDEERGTGLVGQSFCSALQKELSSYFRLLSVLESHVSDSSASSTATLTLKRLYVWTQDPLQRLRMMSVLCDLCSDSRGGGQMVGLIWSYLRHGDPMVKGFVGGILNAVSKPFFAMLSRWVHTGELEDPFDEFFVGIQTTTTIDTKDKNGGTCLWRSKYFMRTEMVPEFFNRGLAKKIFLIGKSLNFIRYSCRENDYIVLRSQNVATLAGISLNDLSSLESFIDSAYTETSKKVLEILFDKYKLMEHLTALKRYLLLGQGDFIQYLMDHLGPSLSKPANSLYRHNLTGTLESAIRASNAQYDNPDILRRLDVRLLEMSPGDMGWDVFSLDYHVDSPISTLLNPQAMHQYLKLFNFLWRLKRVEHDLASQWKRQMVIQSQLGIHSKTMKEESKNSGVKAQVGQELHACYLAWNEMTHFVYQLQYYLLFEVLECSWDELVKFLEKRSGDLDLLIGAHNKYLNNITSKGLLAITYSNGTTKSLLGKLLKIFDIVLEFKGAQDDLFSYVMVEMKRLEKTSGVAYQKTLEGKWGLSAEVDGSAEFSKVPETASLQDALPKLQMRIQQTSSAFRTEVTNLLNILAAQPDINLRFLSFRLNFNEYYKQ